METHEASVNVADAKRSFSDLLGRVAYGRETIVITRRGRPMAKLVPIEKPSSKPNELASTKGWLDDDDPFFQIMDQIVAERQHHRPRVLDRNSKAMKTSKRRKS